MNTRDNSYTLLPGVFPEMSRDILFVVLQALLVVELFSLFILSGDLGRYVLLGSSALLIACLVMISVSRGIRFHLGLSSVLWILFMFFVFVNRGPVVAAGGGLSWFLIVMAALMVSVFVANSSEREVAIGVIMTVICIFALVNAVATIVFWVLPELYDQFFYPLFYQGDTIIGKGYRSGLCLHYSKNGMRLSGGILAAIFLLLKGAERPWKKKFVIAALAVLAFALLLTTKRAHLVFALAAVLAAYSLYKPGKLVFVALVATWAAVVVFVVVSTFSFSSNGLLGVLGRFGDVDNYSSLGGRIGFYQLCLSMWDMSPLVGQGWDSFTEAFSATPAGSHKESLGLMQTNAHNVYLQVLAEEGVIGEVLFLSGAFSSLIATIRLGVRSSGRTRGLAAGSLAFQVFFLLYCLTGNPLYDFVECVPFMISYIIPFGADVDAHRDRFPRLATSLHLKKRG